MEFALVLPLLLILILGIIETGRLMVIYSSISSGAKQAARYGSVAGETGQTVGGSALLAYQDCQGIRQHVRSAMPLLSLTDNEIQILYSPGYLTQTVGSCAPNAITPTISGSSVITNGYQIIISITATYRPIVPIVPIPPLPIRFVSARTIFTSIAGPTKPPPAPPVLQIVKNVNLSSAPNGTTLNYTILLTNTGPSSASNAVLTESWTSNLTNMHFVAVPSGWSCPTAASLTSPVTCTRFTPMISNTMAIFQMQGTINSTLGPVINTARASASRASEVNAAATTAIISGPDLIMIKQVSSNAVQTGQRITYTLSVKNGGQNMGGLATIKVTDTLPVTTLATGLPTGCVNTTTPPANAVLVCTFTANLTSGSTYNIGSFSINAPNFGTTLVNTASTTGIGVSDGNLANNTASVATAVSDNVDLYLNTPGNPTVNAGPDPLIPPDTDVAYNIQVGNNTGVATAASPRLTFTLPSNVTVINSAGTNWNCAPPSGGQILCTYNQSLAPGALANDLDISVRYAGAGGTTLTARTDVWALNQTDTNPSDNTYTRNINVVNCHPNQPDPAHTYVAASGHSVAADGVMSTTVFVQARNDCPGNPLVTASSYVTLTSSRGGADIISTMPSYPNPTGTGIVGFYVRSNTVGTSNYSAQVSTAGNTYSASNTDYVNFTTCNRVSGTASTISASPTEVFADGVAYATIVVTIKDDCGATVSANTWVTLTSSRGGLDIIGFAPGSGSPTTTGIVTFRVKSSTIGTSTYSAQASTTGTGSVVNLTNTANVTYYGCVTGTSGVLSGGALPFNLTNPAGSAWVRRLTDVNLIWVMSPNAQKLQTVTLGGVTLWSGSSTASPTVLGTANWIAGADRTIAVGALKSLSFNFFKTLASGTYTATLTFDDNLTAGGHACTLTVSASKP